MLTTETKRHIDAARQVLVGVVPNPSSQIDQITNALIYKFMDDMDQSAIKAGGEASFFVKDLEKFSWTRLMDARIGNQERMNIYAEALVKFSEAKQLPELFRNIFKSAFLPYRSPEVLGLFLKEIAYFDYSHPEELGNAYEYLLSIMGSQGDAGQFRTPRHIIDFIVDVVNPTKDDKVLDPACGTAGFLISAYKHILAQHDGKNSDGTKNSEKPLTPDERRALVNNFEGYDVDPSMVRIAQVNMYLHKFKNPKIIGYNSLSDDERWGDKFDVILANPPFMSPKGGVSIHNKFSLESTKSEILFVDYIINHLRPKGRAGVIVPEGIIFTASGAYRQLRKNLVENGLYAVVSLPQGVFNPYSPVKTSILFFDSTLAKKTEKILFVRVLNDGFDLGAQRRPIDRNDLVRPVGEVDATKVLKAQRVALETGTVNPWLQENSLFAYEITKEQIAQSGDYGLSAEKYRLGNLSGSEHAKWPMVTLEEVCEINPRKSQLGKLDQNTEVSFVPMADLSENQMDFVVKQIKKISDVTGSYTYFSDNDVLLAKVTPCFENGKAGVATGLQNGIGFGSSEFIVLRPSEKILPQLLYRFVTDKTFKMHGKAQMSGTGGLQRIPMDYVRTYKIPLPPLSVQREIVEQIAGKQHAINHAKEIIKELERERRYFGQSLRKLENVRYVRVGDVSNLVTKGTTPTTNGHAFIHKGINFIKIESITNSGNFISEKFAHISAECHNELRRSQLQTGDVLFSIAGALGRTAVIPADILPANTNQALAIIRPSNEILSQYLAFFLGSEKVIEEIETLKVGVAQYNISLKQVSELLIPLPSLELQKQMVEELEREEEIISANRQLIKLMENKISAVLNDV